MPDTPPNKRWYRKYCGDCGYWWKAQWDVIYAGLLWFYEISCKAQEPYVLKKRIRVRSKNNDGEYDLVVMSNRPEEEGIEYLDPDGYNQEEQRAEQEAEFLASRIPYPLQYFMKAPVFGLTVGWWIICFVGTAAKVAFNDGSFTQFFTNWMWVFNFVFYTFDVISYFDPTGYINFYLIYGVWPPFFGNVAQVFFIVMMILYEHPQLITDEADEFGWGIVILVERIVHVMPFVVQLFWIAMRAPDIILVLKSFQWRRGFRAIFLIYLFMIYVFAHIPFITYIGVYDFHKVYHVWIPEWIGLILAEIIFIMTVLLPVAALSPAMEDCRGYAYRTAPMVTNSKVYKVIYEKPSRTAPQSHVTEL